MKLLFLNAVGEIGGAERMLLTWLATLRSTNPTLHLTLLITGSGPLAAAAQQLGVEVWLLPLPTTIGQIGDSQFKSHAQARPIHTLHKLQVLGNITAQIPALWHYLGHLRQAIQQIQPDLIHSNSIKTHLLMALLHQTALAPIHTPVIWHIHDFYQSRPWVAKILTWAKHFATEAISISYAVAKDAESILHPLPIRVIYNAIDTQQFVPAPLPRHNPHPLRIGLVATFARWKGHQVFLEAAAQIVQQIGASDLALQFWIVGGPIYATPGSEISQSKLQAQINQLHLESYVEFLGFQADMVPIYQSLDIVVHASTEPEPFGLVIVEAMACGKPVIVSKSGEQQSSSRQGKMRLACLQEMS